ncbi:MAG: hypothetical protein IKP95_09355 [Ruminococcus sp.]|nr:hypothetical protein [Ruminococcus sp.]
MLGKSVTDLQSGVQVSGDSISGTLKYVTGYTGFSGDASEQSGNYLAIHCDVASAPDAKIDVEVVGGHHGPTTLDSDRIIILKIESTTQKVKVTASRNGDVTVERVFSLTSLTLNDS